MYHAFRTLARALEDSPHCDAAVGEAAAKSKGKQQKLGFGKATRNLTVVEVFDALKEIAVMSGTKVRLSLPVQFRDRRLHMRCSSATLMIQLALLSTYIVFVS